MSACKDMTGMKFGRLTVLRCADNDIRGQAMWVCECDCGDHSISVVRGADLRSGKVMSCGCMHREHLGNLRRAHGESGTRLYQIWKNMKSRCLNSNNSAYERYGGRGIAVCNEWADDYESFANWARSSGYDDSLTIDRIDVDLGYSPDNCRWITYREQNVNKRCTHVESIDGITKPLIEWCEEYNMPYTLVKDRVNVLGWDIVRALTTPKRKIKNVRR